MPDSIDFTLRFLMFALLHSLLAMPGSKRGCVTCPGIDWPTTCSRCSCSVG